MLQTSVRIIEKLVHSSIVLLLLTPLLFSSTSVASSAYRVNTAIGYDISYPQCDKEFPQYPAYAIIGVNGGRPFTDNKCFALQAKWANKKYAPLSVYQNLSYVTNRFAHYTSAGPNKCGRNDEHCKAYNFGYQASKYAHNSAKKYNVVPKQWWLDIETMNTWSEDKALNRSVIQGAIDYHTAQGHKLGIYSTGYQWGVIAGDFKPGLPAWVAGAKSRAHAPTRCTEKYAFTGGKVQMVQYVKDDLDHNHLCG